MVYSFFIEPAKHVIRNSVDLVIPSNSFNAMATAAAGYVGYLYGGAFSQEKINEIIWNSMNCSKKDHGAEFVATEIGKVVQNNLFENIGMPFAKLYDTVAGGDGMKTWVNEMTTDSVADITQALNCASANAVAMAITPHLSQFSMNYYYPIKFIVFTSVTLNLIAIALFKIHSYCRRCCMTTEQIDLAVAVTPIKAIQDKPEIESGKEIILAESKSESIEVYLQKMEKNYNEKLRSATQPLQNTLDAVTIQLERVSKTLSDLSKKIEEPNSRQPVPAARRVQQKAN